jgi:hypothetical protein
MPRHPPYALKNLRHTPQHQPESQHQECARKNAQIKMLTSTIQFTSNEHTQPSDTPLTHNPRKENCRQFDERTVMPVEEDLSASFPSSRPTRLPAGNPVARSLRTQQRITPPIPGSSANRCSTRAVTPAPGRPMIEPAHRLGSDIALKLMLRGAP